VIYRVTHLTEYHYDLPVSSSHHELHLLLRTAGRQRVRSEELTITPAAAVRRDRIDYFGNRSTHLEIWEPHRHLAVLSRSEVEVTGGGAPRAAGGPAWEEVREAVRAPSGAELVEAASYAYESPYVGIIPAAAELAAPSFAPGRPLLDAVADLTRRIHAEFTYDPRATSVSTPVRDVLEHRRGVCQDFAHLEIACLRALGLPARYVSGYLVTSPPPGQPRLVGADASHAWVAAFCPGAGWFEVDPTNDVVPDEKHVTLAWGRDFGDVTPLRGVVMGGGAHSLTVSVDVVPVAEGGQSPPSAGHPPSQ
jgi:transglutaminase-like putative cysteine protease